MDYNKSLEFCLQLRTDIFLTNGFYMSKQCGDTSDSTPQTLPTPLRKTGDPHTTDTP